jgi:hypothetical protein
MFPASDWDENLVEMPLVTGSRPPSSQLVCVGLPELGVPPPDRLIADHDTAFEHEFLDLRKLSGNPKYSHTQPLMISTG